LRGCKFQELPAVDDSGLLPRGWKVALIAGYEEICTGCVRALKEDIVVRISRNSNRSRRNDKMAMILD
jgi:hypothetical protein